MNNLMACGTLDENGGRPSGYMRRMVDGMNRKIIRNLLRRFNKDIYYYVEFSSYGLLRDHSKNNKIFNTMSKKDLLRYGPANRLAILEVAYASFAEKINYRPRFQASRIATFIYENPNVTMFSPEEIREMLFSATFDDSTCERAQKFIKAYEQSYKKLPRIYKRMSKIGSRISE